MTADRDALQFTLEWVKTNGFAVSGTDVVTELLPITRHVDDIVDREDRLRAAVARVESRRLALV
ncbi:MULTISPECIES: hypothetical protein [unclassified Gordonia (in: high G+C Gram-positive bacteria)]|uniref:hypothetical protein n=1 Tax=unclassified Gordonia (in: high G+C Gram-positive bacteria) TaxID=2657482 RepID=UPI001F0E2D81|nr:hypothetical protein [Gordonia sp. ABSL49_1]MCH5645597.1 hypothetical protein [Gordonia sp. ABSL49_1]